MELPTHMVGKVFTLGSFFEHLSDGGHYGEPGMMVRVKDVYPAPNSNPDNFIELFVDFGEFASHNKAFENEAGKDEFEDRQTGDVQTIVVDPNYIAETMALAEGGSFGAIMDAYAQRADRDQGFQDFLIERLGAAMDAGFDLNSSNTPAAS